MELNDDQRRRLQQAESLSVGGELGDSRVTLAIYSNDLDPGSVSNIVGCSPTRARRIGELDADYPRRGPALVGQWFLEAPENLAFEDKVVFVLDKTTSDVDAWVALGKTHRLQLRCVAYLHSWTESFDLEPALLQRVSERGWTFMLSMYSAEVEEVLDAFLGSGAQLPESLQYN